MDGTDPASSSRRSLGQALAREIKLAEEACRRLEAQRQHRLLQYAAAQPLPDEAAPGKTTLHHHITSSNSYVLSVHDSIGLYHLFLLTVQLSYQSCSGN